MRINDRSSTGNHGIDTQGANATTTTDSGREMVQESQNSRPKVKSSPMEVLTRFFQVN
ncbi:hypothetical protein [Candidatus Ichthyocystis hellenicum]|uniref:hypothetical protein n=1 Tax=Candidatus Ichthyocystis hellenicum TaxID=1561003 RepID=UPI0015857949|nr:hypothetical protein [Candidatus Ichthyocystis hellenicum]